MATNKEIDELKDYINMNWEMHPYEGKKAIEVMDHSHCPLEMANRELYDTLCDMIEDFANDNDLGDEWIDEIDVESIFFDCDVIFGYE